MRRLPSQYRFAASAARAQFVALDYDHALKGWQPDIAALRRHIAVIAQEWRSLSEVGVLRQHARQG